MNHLGSHYIEQERTKQEFTTTTPTSCNSKQTTPQSLEHLDQMKRIHLDNSLGSSPELSMKMSKPDGKQANDTEKHEIEQHEDQNYG